MSDDEELKHALERLSAQMEEPGIREWLSLREEAGRRINPQTAEVFWRYGQTLDPYGVCYDFPSEVSCIERVYFACDPETGTCVTFYDLPEATAKALEPKMKDWDHSFENMDWLFDD